MNINALNVLKGLNYFRTNVFKNVPSLQQIQAPYVMMVNMKVYKINHIQKIHLWILNLIIYSQNQMVGKFNINNILLIKNFLLLLQLLIQNVIKIINNFFQDLVCIINLIVLTKFVYFIKIIISINLIMVLLLNLYYLKVIIWNKITILKC